VEGLPALLEIGIRQVRLELLDEDAASTQHRVRLYADALLGRRALRDVWSQEQIHHQLGVTRGSLRVKGPERTSQISR
jgi:putative protease